MSSLLSSSPPLVCGRHGRDRMEETRKRKEGGKIRCAPMLRTLKTSNDRLRGTTVCKNLVGDGSVFVCFLALRFVFCLLVFATFTTSSSSVSYSYICPRPRPLLLLVSLVCSLCLSFSPLIFSSSPAFSECTSFKVAIWIGRAVFTVWP